MALQRMCPVRVFRLSLNCRLETTVSSIHSKIWPAVFDSYTADSPDLPGKANFERISRCGIEGLRVGLNRRNQSFKFLIHDLCGRPRTGSHSPCEAPFYANLTESVPRNL